MVLDNSPMTQPVRMTDEEMGIFKDVDEVVGKSILIGDPVLAFEYGSHLRRRQAIEGLALAKLLYRMNESWDLFRSAGISDDLTTMAHVQMGIPPETSKKYLRMWESVFANEGITDDIKKILMGRPIGDLLLLTAAAREGSLNDEQMMAAALAPDRNSLRDIIKDARGEHTSAGTAVRIMVVRADNLAAFPKGTLLAKRGEDRVPFGQLDFDTGSEIADKAIERILNTLGVVEIYGN